MVSMVYLDVLVVYSASLATSASVEDAQSKHPFLLASKQANYNLSYAYFLDECRRLGLKAGLATSADVTGPGTCSTYWIFQSSKWVKVRQHVQANHIFDKISPTTPVIARQRQLLFSDKKIKPFNDPELFQTFFDKLKTYREFPDYAIPTVAVNSSKKADVQLALTQLRNLLESHDYPADFSSKIVLKDRCGSSGNYVYQISTDFAVGVQTRMRKNPEVHFVLQPFLPFDRGYVYQNHHTSTDLRLIFHHDQMLQCYIRMAKAHDFRCNEHQGGQLEYVTGKDIPKMVSQMAGEIVGEIAKPQSLYALDFVISNTGRAYFIEGNIGPGLDWDVTKKVNENMSKQLIRSIVKEIALRVRKQKIANWLDKESLFSPHQLFRDAPI